MRPTTLVHAAFAATLVLTLGGPAAPARAAELTVTRTDDDDDDDNDNGRLCDGWCGGAGPWFTATRRAGEERRSEQGDDVGGARRPDGRPFGDSLD